MRCVRGRLRVLVVPLALVLGACSGTEATRPPAPSVTTTSTSSKPSTTQTTSPSVAGVRPGVTVVPGWNAIVPDDPEHFTDARVRAAIEWRGQLVASTSRDLDPPLETSPTPEEPAAPEGPRATLWTTDDGGAWRSVDPEPPNPEAELVGLAVMDDALLALWTHLEGDTNRILSVAITDDLETWERHEVGRGNFFAGIGHLAATPARAAVFTVEYVAGSGEQRIWLWGSDDARTWERVEPPPEVLLEANAASLTAVGNRFVMGGTVGVGQHNLRSAAVWTSDDARTWRRSVIEPRASVAAVSGHTGGFVVAGGRYPFAESGDADAVVWTSPDGERWRALDDPQGVLTGPDNQFGAHLFVRGPDRIELAGRDDPAPDPRAAGALESSIRLGLWGWDGDRWSEKQVPGVEWQATTMWGNVPIAFASRGGTVELWRGDP